MMRTHDVKTERQRHIEITVKEQSQRLVTFVTVITFLRIENNNPYTRSLFNQEWLTMTVCVLVMSFNRFETDDITFFCKLWWELEALIPCRVICIPTIFPSKCSSLKEFLFSENPVLLRWTVPSLGSSFEKKMFSIKLPQQRCLHFVNRIICKICLTILQCTFCKIALP